MRFYRAFTHFFLVLLLITAAHRINAQATAPDTAVIDTSARKGVRTEAAKSFLDSKVLYKAKDSIRFDLVEQKVYLFGAGDVTYESINLQADFIEIDLTRKTIHAKYTIDSLGRQKGKPVFTESDKSFSTTEMWYNFETKKGRILEVRTKEGEGHIHGEVVKKDSNDVSYIKGGKYTTCDLEHPHYAIIAGKLKVIPDDKIITGPAYLEVSDIPTPLGIPFGFFPNKKGQASGIIMPTYGESQLLGFFLQDGGYYFGINDTFDLALRGDIYSYGSWAIDAETSYRIRYKYNGRLQLSYARMIFDDPELPGFKPNNDFLVNWSHEQDRKANPNSTFSASVNAGSSTYNRYNSTNTYNYLNNQLRSNIRYMRTFTGRRFGSNLSLNALHSQNTITREIIISAPELVWSVNRFYPAKMFKRPNRIVKNTFLPQLYNNIGISFVSNAKNEIKTQDTILINPRKYGSTFDDFTRYGIKHSMPISSNAQVGPVSVVPSFNASSTWYYRTIEKTFVPTDTIAPVQVNYKDGFEMANEWSAALTASMRLTNRTPMLRRPIGKLLGVRHVITPTLGLSYRPDYSTERWGYYREVQTETAGTYRPYSIFEEGIFGYPPSGRSGNVSWSFNNNVEAKLRDSKDTTGTGTKKVPIIESLLISGGYNVAADHYKWLPTIVTGRTTLFKVVTININGAFDPYAFDTVLRRRIERFEYKANGRPFRLTNAGAAFGTSLQSRKKNDKPKESTKGSQQELEFINNNPDAFVDFNVPWTMRFTYTLRYDNPGITQFKTFTQTVNLDGDLSVTPKWKVGFTSNYDLVQGQFSYTSLNIYRDLHCWEMVFNWIPFGPRQSYTVDIRVKAPVLSDLKLTRRRGWQDYDGWR